MEQKNLERLQVGIGRWITALNLFAMVTLTGCEGVYDAFNKKIPEGKIQADPVASDEVFDDTSSGAVSEAGHEAPTVTRINAAGSVAGDPEMVSNVPRSPTNDQRSGSRIRTKILVTDEDDRAFLGWYDSQRHEDCDFMRDTEGTMRCLPIDTEGTLGDTAELNQFVAADYAIIANQSRVKAYGLIAEDGAVSTSSFYDENTDLGCIWRGEGDAVRCVPQAQRISYYVDQAHTRLLIQGDLDSSSVAPNIGEHYHANSCTSDYYRSGETYQGAQVFQRGSSDGRPIVQGETFYELGDPIDGDSLARASVESDTADSGRLTALYWTTLKGGAWFSHWYDNLLQTPCTFTRGTDPRCVPDSSGVRVYYADSQCAEPVAEVFPENECRSELHPPRYVAVAQSDVDGEQVLAAYAVLNERTLTTLYEKMSESSCAPRVAAERGHYFGLGEPVPASDLVGGQIVVE